ncbi:MAG: putative adhesin, partial [Acidimicrobiales bacterium]
MTTIVRAHGGWDNAGWTFVPDGATIKFFSDNNENLITANALSVLAKGNFSNANQTYGPGNTSNDEPAWVPNYELEARSSGEMQRDLSAFAEGADLVFVGDDLKSPIKLCEDTTGQCKDGVHECSGVLGQVKDTDIVYLACRGIVTDADSTSTEGVGAPEERSTETLDFIREMYGLWATDKDAFETRFDQLDQARQAEVMAGYAELKNHILVREMRSFADQEPVLFYRQVQAMIRDKARLGIGDDEAFAA